MILGVLIFVSYAKNLKTIYFAIVINQFFTFLSLNQDSGVIKHPQVVIVTEILDTLILMVFLIINQMFLTNLFTNHKNKLQCLFYILVYFTLISRIVGLDCVLLYPTVTLKKSMSLLFSMFMALYIFQKLQNLNRVQMQVVDNVIIDLKTTQQKDKQLKVVLNSLE